MDKDSARILKAVMGEEVAPKRLRNIPVDHWTPAVLLERASICASWQGTATAWAARSCASTISTSAYLRSATGPVSQRFTNSTPTCFSDPGRRHDAGYWRQDCRRSPRRTGRDAWRRHRGRTSQPLRVGDVAHVPAGMPHQMLVNGTDTVTYFVMKNQESI